MVIFQTDSTSKNTLMTAEENLLDVTATSLGNRYLYGIWIEKIRSSKCKNYNDCLRLYSSFVLDHIMSKFWALQCEGTYNTERQITKMMNWSNEIFYHSTAIICNREGWHEIITWYQNVSKSMVIERGNEEVYITI